MRDGTSLGSNLMVASKQSVAFLCDAQSNPAPKVWLENYNQMNFTSRPFTVQAFCFFF